MARRPQYRPGTRLGVLALLLIAAYAFIGISGDTPRLGIDLDGGTEVTLQPKTLAGKAASTDALNQAVDILRRRVDGLGVGGATVARQGGNIVVTVPGKGRDTVLSTIGSTAQLYFRQVACNQTSTTCDAETAAATTTTPSTTPSASAAASAPASATVAPAATPSASATKAAASSAAASSAASSSAAASTAASASATAHGRPLPEVAAASSAATSASATTSASVKASASASASASAKASASSSVSVSPTPSATGSAAASGSASAKASGSPSPSASPSPSLSATQQKAVSTSAMTCIRAGGEPSVSGAKVTCAKDAGPCTAAKKKADAGKSCAVLTYEALDCSIKSNENIGAQDAAADWSVGCGLDQPLGYLLNPSSLSGTEVKNPSAQPQTTSTGQASVFTGQWQVNLDFTSKGSKAFEALTAKTASLSSSVTGEVAIVLDGVVQSAPTNTQALPGPIQITGSFTQDQAENLANTLKYGALPLSFQDQPQAVTVSATLGHDQLRAGLLAGGLGLLLVIIYCFIYYRALGFVTILSLGVSGAAVYATTTLLGRAVGYTLSLAGIAGFIVAVGITADSFVVFFERLRDEIREGRSARSGVEAGWLRARRTILSADAISILAAVVLYAVSIGDVRGFAFTLGVSTALDLVTVFLFTKPLVSLLVRRRFFSTGKWSGLSTTLPDAPIRRRPGPSRRPPTAPQAGEV